MSGKDIRRTFMRRFAAFSKQRRIVAFAIVASFATQILAAVLFGHWLLHSQIGPLGRAAFAGIVMLFIGTRLRGLNNIVHECSHATFAVQRGDNALCGRFCAALILGCFTDYRADHLTHHAHLGDYAHDRDLQGIRALRLEAPLTLRTILRHIVTPLLGRHLRYYLHPNFSARDGRVFLALKLGLVAAAAALAVLAPLTALLFVALPYLWVFTALNYWTDCIDHAGILASGDELTASRNVRVPGWLRVLLFPRNDCFHLVHHLFPQVPSQHLGACHRQLLEDPDYRRQVGAAPPARPVRAEKRRDRILRPAEAGGHETVI